ncbi:MAG: PatB family C-S lyase [Oscillospiraceae bacterium]|nr:PatB family C-S lyase [Oscillospiraceae bacterium]
MNNIFDEPINRKGTNCSKFDGLIAQFGTEDIQPLWIADMDFPVAQEITDAIRKRAEHPVYGYNTVPAGYYESFAAWQKKHTGWEVDTEWICHTPGVLTALSTAILAFTEKNDSILIQPPVYFPFSSTIEALGRNVLNNQLNYKDGYFTIDFDDLERKAKQASLFVFCSPHNPSGRVWTKEELERIESICRKNNLMVFSDEIHSDIVYPPNKHSVFADLSAWSKENCIVAMAPSKTFNIAGLEASYISIPNQEKRKKYQYLLRFGLHVANGNTFGIAAAQAAYEHGERWYGQLLDYLNDNREYLDRALQENVPQVRLVKSEATYILFLDMTALGMNTEELKDFVLHKVRAALNIGATFGPGGEGFMRINIATQRANLEKFVERLRNEVLRLYD